MNCLISKYNIPNEIKYNIEDYLYDKLKLKKEWKNKMQNVHFEINNYNKLVPVFKNKGICIECYLSAIIKNTTYIELNQCEYCYINNQRNEIIKYIFINFNNFKLLNNKVDLIYRILSNSNKDLFYLSIINKNDNLYHNKSSINYEITRGPLFWGLLQDKAKVLNKFK